MRVKGLLVAAMLLVSGMASAQVMRVEESEQVVSGVKRSGQQLSVQLDPKFVEKIWKDHLSQEAGKVKHSKGVYTVEEAKLKKISKDPMRVISTVGTHATGSYVWWALDLGTAYADKNATPEVYAAAERFMEDFGKKLYQEDVLLQINEAENVLRDTKKEQDRVVKQANDLQLSIEKNKKRKQELEAELVRNADELRQLEQNVELNARQQEASRQQVQAMERAVEEVRAKLRDIK
ncbi:DNA repair ATPase [uncultured Pontibacter sp.]|uniref:DNA repair ATPase n=1 Tax=uncultured Pontibacter sp. TaxID=453356 RepID=UPI00262E1229|nr:DNA repair ATPase [uncultured Pontibacter sp.]